MDAEGLKDLFEPFGTVSVKRVFSGYGVYSDGLCFALNLRGEIYLKADAQTQPSFAAAGSEPFVYDGARGRVMVTSYWRLVASAYDDADELRTWSRLALEAARRFAEAKAAKAARRGKPKAPAGRTRAGGARVSAKAKPAGKDRKT